jgi:prophage antirepressor-like protein
MTYEKNPNATSVQVFNFQSDVPVRVSMIRNNPWFVAKDVCNVLELTNSRQHVALLDVDEKGVCSIYTLGGNQNMSVISESGLYALIFQSRKPVSKKFRKWVTSEVLPSLRKTGHYGVQPENTVSLQDYQHLKMLLGIEKQLRELLQKQRDYYVNDRDDWRNRALERNESMMQMIVGIA